MEKINRVGMGVKQSPDDQNKGSCLRSRGGNPSSGDVAEVPVDPLIGSSLESASDNRLSLDDRKSQQSQSGFFGTLFSNVTKIFGGVYSDTLHGCIVKHNIEGLKNRLKNDLDAEDSEGKTPLGYAVYEKHPYSVDRGYGGSGSPEMVKLLLDAGANADRNFTFQKDPSGRLLSLTPFQILIWKSPENGVEIAKLLLDAKDKKIGANWITGERCSTYLIKVIEGYCNYSYELIDLLLKKGADPNSYIPRLKRPVIFRAIVNNNFKSDIVRRLLDCGANPKTSWGENSEDCPLGRAKHDLDKEQGQQAEVENSITLFEKICVKLQQCLTVDSDCCFDYTGIHSDWEKARSLADLPNFNCFLYIDLCEGQTVIKVKDVMINQMIIELNKGIEHLKKESNDCQDKIARLDDIVDLIESAISK